MKRTILIAVLAALVLALPAGAAPTGGMTLAYDYFYNSANLVAPSWCYHEDSYHARTWMGTLKHGESFTVTMRYCDITKDFDVNGDGWDQGGQGMYFRVAYWTGHYSLLLTLTEPGASAPRGQTSLISSDRDWTQVGGCVLRGVSYEPLAGTDPSNPGGGRIMSDTYLVMLTNTGKDISAAHPINLVVNTQMTDDLLVDQCRDLMMW